MATSSGSSSSSSGGTRTYNAPKSWNEYKRQKGGGGSSKKPAELLPGTAGAGSPLPTGKTSLSPAEVTAAYQLDAAKKALAAGNDAEYSRRIVLYRGAQEAMNQPVRLGGSARALTIVDSTGQATNVVTATRERYRAETPAQMRRLGVSAPGVYERTTRVENRPVQRQFYEDFGTGQRVSVDRSNRFAYSPSPLLSTQVENVAGLGPTVETRRYVERQPGLVRSGLAVTETSITPTSGAQAQLLAAGLNRVTGKGSTDPFATSPQPFVARLRQEETLKSRTRQRGSDTWDYVMNTRGFLFLTNQVMDVGNSLERGGASIANRASENWKDAGSPTKGWSALSSRVAYDTGAAVRSGGQFVQGLSENTRERPLLVGTAIVVAAAGGAVARGLSFASQVGLGGSASAYGLWAFRGAAAFGAGYWGASEADAIARSERPGERASATALQLGGFAAGSALVSGTFAIPEQRTTRVTSSRGVVAQSEGGLYGQVTRRGYVQFEKYGRSWKVPFEATESYGGDLLQGRVVYRGGATSVYRGVISRLSPQSSAYTMAREWSGRSLVIFEQRAGGRTVSGAESLDFTRAGFQGQKGAGYDVLGSTFSSTGGQANAVGGSVRGPRSVLYFEPQNPALPTRGVFLFQPSAVQTFGQGSGLAQGFAPGTGLAPGLPALAVANFAGRGLAPQSVLTLFSVPEQSRESRVSVSVQQLAGLQPRQVQETTLLTSLVRLQGQKSEQGLITQVVQTPAQDTFTDTRTDQIYRPLPPETDYWSDPVPPPPTPWGEPGVPGWGFGAGSKSFGRSGRAGFRSRYNPSLVATVLDIRGSRRQGGLAAMTGVAVRPIV